MSISIVIPTYNGEKYLSETLDSVLAQSFPNWEVIVVDDGSKDGTRAVAQEYARRDPRIRVVAKDNGGESTARNRGYAETDPKRPFVIFLDHDDLWETDTLQTLRDALETDPDAIGAYGIGQFVAHEGTPIAPGMLEDFCRLRKKLRGSRFVDCGPTDPTTFDTIAYHLSIPTPGVCLLRRARLPGAGGELFWTALRHGSGDIHLWLRLARTGHFLFVDTSLYRSRRHDNNMTNKHKLIEASMLDAHHDVAMDPETTEAQRNILKMAYRQRQQDKANDHLGWATEALKKKAWRSATKNLAKAVRNNIRAVIGMPRGSLSPFFQSKTPEALVAASNEQ